MTFMILKNSCLRKSKPFLDQSLDQMHLPLKIMRPLESKLENFPRIKIQI